MGDMFETWGRYGGEVRKKEKKKRSKRDLKFLSWSRKWFHWKVVDQGGFHFYVPCLEHS